MVLSLASGAEAEPRARLSGRLWISVGVDVEGVAEGNDEADAEAGTLEGGLGVVSVPEVDVDAVVFISPDSVTR